MKPKKDISLSRIMKYAKKNNIDTDAVLDLWNYNPKALQDFYLADLTKPSSAHKDDIFDLHVQENTKATNMAKDYRAREYPDFKNLQYILSKLRQELKYNVTDEGLEVRIRVSSQFYSESLEETIIFPEDAAEGDKDVERVIDHTISALSYEYLLNL